MWRTCSTRAVVSLPVRRRTRAMAIGETFGRYRSSSCCARSIGASGTCTSPGGEAVVVASAELYYSHFGVVVTLLAPAPPLCLLALPPSLRPTGAVDERMLTSRRGVVHSASSCRSGFGLWDSSPDFRAISRSARSSSWPGQSRLCPRASGTRPENSPSSHSRGRRAPSTARCGRLRTRRYVSAACNTSSTWPITRESGSPISPDPARRRSPIGSPGQRDTIAIHAGFDSWLYPLYGRTLQRKVLFIEPGQPIRRARITSSSTAPGTSSGLLPRHGAIQAVPLQGHPSPEDVAVLKELGRVRSIPAPLLQPRMESGCIQATRERAAGGSTGRAVVIALIGSLAAGKMSPFDAARRHAARRFAAGPGADEPPGADRAEHRDALPQ